MIDHLVYATPDLEATVVELAERLGTEPVPGGRHVGFGTRNELVGLGGGTYLEIIGPDEDDHRDEMPFGIHALRGSKLVAWCARPRDLDRTLRRASDAGWITGEASPMSRRRPDGSLLEWRLTQPSLVPGEAAPLPFFIDWGASAHPTGTLATEIELVSLTVTHPDPERMDRFLSAVGEAASVELREGRKPALSALLATPYGSLTLT